MKIVFVSDIHGAADGARLALDAALRHRADEVILCGDLLSGRRFLPAYDPDRVALLLNGIPCAVTGVRGNCDSASDERTLGFKLHSYVVRQADGYVIFVTHGHLYGEGHLPPDVAHADVIVTGHSHRGRIRVTDRFVGLNDGSASYPRAGVATYGLFQDGVVTLRDAEGTILEEVALAKRV